MELKDAEIGDIIIDTDGGYFHLWRLVLKDGKPIWEVVPKWEMYSLLKSQL